MTADPKECFGCGQSNFSWKRDETGRFYCHSCNLQDERNKQVIYEMRQTQTNRRHGRCTKDVGFSAQLQDQ